MSCHRTTRAFTLVELLVVIGIIALLISILLPALSKARESANRVACLSNQRQIFLAMAMYAGANRDFLPTSGTSPSSNISPIRADWGVDAAGGTPWPTALGRLWYHGYLGSKPSFVDSNPGVRYAANEFANILNCPSNNHPRFQPSTFLSQVQVSYFRYQYGNAPKLTSGFTDGFSSTRYKFTSRKALLFDSNYESSTTWRLQPNPVHNGKGLNVVYGDGSGQFVPVPATRMVFHENSGGYALGILLRWLDRDGVNFAG
jgi:prepilin-type N-terminal cleavage/methylation domain-containing protein/prepilin-type processing-associated H-X9-DG protein